MGQEKKNLTTYWRKIFSKFDQKQHKAQRTQTEKIKQYVGPEDNYINNYSNIWNVNGLKVSIKDCQTG